MTEPTSTSRFSSNPSSESGSSSQIPGRIDDSHLTMSLGDHLEDLRKRVFLAVVGIIPIFVIAFGCGRYLLNLLITPARKKLLDGGQGSSLLATGPFETFGTVVHLAVVVTLLLGSPWILYHLWRFISPGLYKHERRVVYLLIPFSGLLTILSMLFLYYVILPVILSFFITYGSNVSGTPHIPTAPIAEGIVIPTIPVLQADPENATLGMTWINESLMQQRVVIGMNETNNTPIIRTIPLTADIGIVQQYRISEYIKAVLNMGLAFGIAFQTPVVVVMLGWVGLLDPRAMGKYRKHAVTICAILGAFLTPADPLSMVLLAAPLYALYELGLFILRVFPISRVIGDIKEQQDQDAITHEDHSQ
ncbi:MAG: twin-arginine translocase subunit TatC [Phycisphaerales bacterium]|nr:twin-arginine translocase subunit TatC [Phycisphaerales bacterium]